MINQLHWDNRFDLLRHQFPLQNSTFVNSRVCPDLVDCHSLKCCRDLDKLGHNFLIYNLVLNFNLLNNIGSGLVDPNIYGCINKRQLQEHALLMVRDVSSNIPYFFCDHYISEAVAYLYPNFVLRGTSVTKERIFVQIEKERKTLEANAYVKQNYKYIMVWRREALAEKKRWLDEDEWKIVLSNPNHTALMDCLFGLIYLRRNLHLPAYQHDNFSVWFLRQVVRRLRSEVEIISAWQSLLEYLNGLPVRERGRGGPSYDQFWIPAVDNGWFDLFTFNSQKIKWDGALVRTLNIN